ncbi:hypothetical protein RB597_005816 [Gaeumannomyces tritici]
MGFSAICAQPINFEEYFSRLTDMLERIGDNLPRCRVYQELFPHHKPLQDGIARMFMAVVDFVRDAETVFKSSSRVFKESVWKPFDERFHAQLVELRLQGDKVEKEAVVAHQLEVSRKLSQANAALSQTNVELSCVRAKLCELETIIRSGEQAFDLVEIRRWLNARECHEERGGIRRLEHSCEWALRLPELAAWRCQEHVQVLWVHGPVGCGKSFLYSRLLEYVEHDMGMPSTFFFFCEADNGRVNVSALLRSWAFQLVRSIWMADHCPEAMDRIRHHLAYRPRATREATVAEVSELLLTLLQAPDTPTCILTADALDECCDFPQFFHFLVQIPKRFKVLATSIGLQGILNQFGALGSRLTTIAITPEMTRHDITHYLRKEVATLRIQGDVDVPEHCKSQILTRLSNPEEEETFLSARFMLEDIRGQISTAGITQCLDRLPKSLADRYDRVLADVNALPAERRLLAHQVFFWVMMARRPLSVRELCAALLVRPTAGRTWRLAVDQRILGDPTDMIHHVCHSLIKARGDEGKLYPIHASVTRHLRNYMNTDERRAELAASYGIGQRLPAEGLAAAVCMRYLSSSFIAELQQEDHKTSGCPDREHKELRPQDDRFDFLSYAATQWFHHAQHIGASDQFLLNIASELLDSQYPNMGIIWRIHWFSDAQGKDPKNCPSAFSGLHIGAYFGLLEIVRCLLKGRVPGPAPLDGWGNSPLYWAALKIHKPVVELLAEAGFNLVQSSAAVDCS